MTQPELRHKVRYDIQLPCEASSPFKAFDRLRGVTANVSRHGVLLLIERGATPGVMPRLGHAARILLRLPRSEEPRARYVECLGRVVRLEDREDARAVAFEFQRFEFTTGDPPSASAPE